MLPTSNIIVTPFERGGRAQTIRIQDLVHWAAIDQSKLLEKLNWEYRWTSPFIRENPRSSPVDNEFLPSDAHPCVCMRFLHSVCICKPKYEWWKNLPIGFDRRWIKYSRKTHGRSLAIREKTSDIRRGQGSYKQAWKFFATASRRPYSCESQSEHKILRYVMNSFVNKHRWQKQSMMPSQWCSTPDLVKTVQSMKLFLFLTITVKHNCNTALFRDSG